MVLFVASSDTSYSTHSITITSICSIMAPSVLGIGISLTFAGIPDEARPHIVKALQELEDQMKASEYEFAMLYLEPDQPDLADRLSEKLQEKEWDVVCLGSESCPAPSRHIKLSALIQRGCAPCCRSQPSLSGSSMLYTRSCPRPSSA